MIDDVCDLEVIRLIDFQQIGIIIKTDKVKNSYEMLLKLSKLLIMFILIMDAYLITRLMLQNENYVKASIFPCCSKAPQIFEYILLLISK